MTDGHLPSRPRTDFPPPDESEVPKVFSEASTFASRAAKREREGRPASSGRRLVSLGMQTITMTDKRGDVQINELGEPKQIVVEVFLDLNDRYYRKLRYPNGMEEEHYLGRSEIEEKVVARLRVGRDGMNPSGHWPKAQEAAPPEPVELIDR